MNYLYYPGCSLEGTSVEYNLSTKSLMAWWGCSLEEVRDWTCCGASAAQTRSRLLSQVLPARNLALAETMKSSDQILIPCSACYLNLKKTEQTVKQDSTLHDTINQVLAEENLVLTGGTKVRHLLDVLVNDLEPQQIKDAAGNKMEGVTAAPYYGCQCLRPFAVFDDPEDPHSMDDLIRATGAVPFNWDMGSFCCGASHTTTKPEAGLVLVKRILDSAKGADLIVTVCPMCQMNLEGYQKKLSAKYNLDLEIPVLFLPQFLGLAVGIEKEVLGLGLNLSNMTAFLSKIKSPVTTGAGYV
jgi:heterodisulfide reductase subunit B